MEPVFNQAPKAGHVYFVTDTYIQCIISNLYSLKNILAEDNLGVLFNTGVNIYIKNNENNVTCVTLWGAYFFQRSISVMQKELTWTI